MKKRDGNWALKALGGWGNGRLCEDDERGREKYNTTITGGRKRLREMV